MGNGALNAAIGMVAFPLGVGLFVWLVNLGFAASVNAKARLLEAQNAAKAAPLPDNTGGKS